MASQSISTRKHAKNGTDAVQEEEESPAEGSKDEPAEQGELKEEAEPPAEETSQPPPSEPKGDAAREGEKPDEKESGDKPEAHAGTGHHEPTSDAGYTTAGSPHLPQQPISLLLSGGSPFTPG